MQALILAAGMGNRLTPISQGLPKCLLQVGGRAIIDHQLQALADNGVGPVTMVIGYAADLVQDHVGRRAEYVLNPRYDTTNSLYSLWLARERVRPPLLLLNCDILFHPAILLRLLETGADSLAYDSLSGDGREHMKVVFQNSVLADIGKTVSPEQASGENVGMICLGEPGWKELFSQADRLIAEGRTQAWIAEALQTAARKVSIRGVDITGLPWQEIDFPYDLERARREVWPAIKAAGRHPGLKRKILIGGGILAFLFAVVAGWFLFPREQSWETVALAPGQKVVLHYKDTPHHWWRLDKDQTGEARVDGPCAVRIQVRPILSSQADEHIPSVVEINVDGRPRKYLTFRWEPDPDAVLEGRIVGESDKISVEISTGAHSIGIRQIAGAPLGFLVRLRRPEQE